MHVLESAAVMGKEDSARSWAGLPVLVHCDSGAARSRQRCSCLKAVLARLLSASVTAGELASREDRKAQGASRRQLARRSRRQAVS
jgi:hypothetical protein